MIIESSDIALDILLPTGRQRLNNLLFQIRAILSSTVNARPIVLMGGNWPELQYALSDSEKKQIRIYQDAPDVPQLKGQQKVLWALEQLDLAPWVAYFSDDDALLPWGLEALMKNTENVSMVMGRVLGVSRDNHLDFTPYTINKGIIRNQCSNAGAIYKTESLRALSKPWINLQEPCSDWELIRRMGESYQYKIIPDTISVLTLYEMEQFNSRVQQAIRLQNEPVSLAIV